MDRAPAAVPLVVLDTNVALDWVAFADARFAPVAAAIARGALRVVTDHACVQELQRVLAYPQLGIAAEARRLALDRYLAQAQCAAHANAQTEPRLPACADPDDQKFLELAWHVRADYLLTRDKALLALARSVGRLCRLAILDPEAFVRRALQSAGDR